MHSFFRELFTGALISDELLGEMTTTQNGRGLGVEDAPGTAEFLGIEFDPPRLGDGLYGHGGGIPGFITMVLHAPDTGRTSFWVGTSEAINPSEGVLIAAPLLSAETLARCAVWQASLAAADRPEVLSPTMRTAVTNATVLDTSSMT